MSKNKNAELLKAMSDAVTQFEPVQQEESQYQPVFGKNFTAVKLKGFELDGFKRKPHWFVRYFFSEEIETEIHLSLEDFPEVDWEILQSIQNSCEVAVPRNFEESLELRKTGNWAVWVYTKEIPERNFFF